MVRTTLSVSVSFLGSFLRLFSSLHFSAARGVYARGWLSLALQLEQRRKKLQLDLAMSGPSSVSPLLLKPNAFSSFYFAVW